MLILHHRSICTYAFVIALLCVSPHFVYATFCVPPFFVCPLLLCHPNLCAALQGGPTHGRLYPPLQGLGQGLALLLGLALDVDEDRVRVPVDHLVYARPRSWSEATKIR